MIAHSSRGSRRFPASSGTTSSQFPFPTHGVGELGDLERKTAADLLSSLINLKTPKSSARRRVDDARGAGLRPSLPASSARQEPVSALLAGEHQNVGALKCRIRSRSPSLEISNREHRFLTVSRPEPLSGRPSAWNPLGSPSGAPSGARAHGEREAETVADRAGNLAAASVCFEFASSAQPLRRTLDPVALAAIAVVSATRPHAAPLEAAACPATRDHDHEDPMTTPPTIDMASFIVACAVMAHRSRLEAAGRARGVELTEEAVRASERLVRLDAAQQMTGVAC